MNTIVSSCPISLAFNKNEAGKDEYIDTQLNHVIVHFPYPHCSKNIHVRRKCKRSTLIHCICAERTILNVNRSFFFNPIEFTL